jgi:uncharacterized protein
VVLAVVRLRTRAIAACIGLHAAWVCTIALVRQASMIQTDAPANWLVGSYDGVIGWGALGWMALLLVIYAIATRSRTVHPSEH